MKTIDNYINEKLKLNNQSKLQDKININFDSDLMYGDKEINIVTNFAHQLKIKPVEITNRSWWMGNSYINKSAIYLYFDEHYKDEDFRGRTGIGFEHWKSYWRGQIIIDNKTKYSRDNDDIKVICDYMLKYLNKFNEFYDSIKNN